MKTSYFANKILNEAKDTMFLALFNGNPTQDGIEVIQVSRSAIPTVSANDGYLANSSAMSVTPSLALTQPTIANHWGVYDAATGGNLLYYFPISYDVLCEPGVAIPIGVGSLVLKEA